MQDGQMKNMVVLKNLPSNIIDEAIIILKANKKVKNVEYTKNNEKDNKQEKKEEGYIIKEAELIVENYLSEIEHKRNPKIHEFEKKYNRLKYVSFALAFIALVEFIIM